MEADKMNSDQLAKVKALLIKKGYKESDMTKNWFFIEDGSDRAADLRKDAPIIGILISGNIVTSGHGNLKVEDDITEVEAIMKSKTIPTPKSPATDLSAPPKADAQGSNPASGGIDKGTQSRQMSEPTKPIPSESKLSAGDPPITPIKKGTTTAICQSCKCEITGTIDIFRQIQDEYGVIYCQKCSEKADGKVEVKEEPPKASAKSEPKMPVKTCKSCGLELSGARALECFQKDKAFTCEECESEPQVPEVTKQQIPARQPDARIPAQTYTPQGNIIKGFQPSLKEIGKIKIGGKGEERAKAGGGTFRLPVKFDHFEIVSLMRDENGDFIKDPVMQTLGESPKELDIFLLFNDPTLNFVSRYNQYQGGKCLCQGDGVKATVSIPDKNGNKIIDCDPNTCPQFAQKKCKPNGILSVILTKSPRLGGVYKFRTTSFNSIRSILSSLFFLSNLTGGVLAMIPLKLTVSPMQVQPKDSTKPQTIFVVNIEFSGTAPELLQKTFDVQKYQSAMRENIIRLESTARAILTAPESKEEINEIEAEFYPKQTEVVK